MCLLYVLIFILFVTILTFTGLISIDSPKSNNNDSAVEPYHDKQYYGKPRKLSRRDRKRIQKAIDKAEMDAWEDMMMYYEVFSDWD